MKLLQSFIISWLLLLIAIPSNGEPFEGENIQISLLTVSPSNIATFTVYGHTSVRVKDTSSLYPEADYVFNYGIFDFSKPNFIYRFAKGETDYKLEYYPTNNFLIEYQLRGSEVFEQILNLTPKEKKTILQKLLVNARPENQVYRYNFFYDNCSTRPEAIIRQSIEGTINYPALEKPVSFRDMINHCTRHDRWITFGCDLIIGFPADQIVSVQESFFIPDYLKNAYSKATITNPDGSNRKLVTFESAIVEAIPEDTSSPTFFSPNICFLSLFCLILLLTGLEWRKRTYFRWLDFLLFILAGLAGCIVFFLCFFSEHPAMWPNLSICWLHPLHLVGSIIFVIKKLNKAAYWYHFINFAALLLMGVVWIGIPQHINIAALPLIATILLRSGSYVFRKNKMK